MHKKDKLWIILLLAACISLSACGFQLRSTTNQPQTIHSISLKSNPGEPISLEQRLISTLNLHGIEVNNTAAYILSIDHSTFTRRRVASSRTSFTDRFKYYYQLQLNLSQHSKTWSLISNQQRLFEADENIPAGKERERELILHELEQTAIDELVQRIRTFKPQQNNPNTTKQP